MQSSKFRNKQLIFLWLIISCAFSVDIYGQLQTPQVDTISIINGKPVIHWAPNNDNTIGYVILRNELSTGKWFEIDTVFGIQNTFYTDQEADPCIAEQLYKIYAFGPGINNNSPWTVTFRTIFLDIPELNICGNYVKLNWTFYENMAPSLQGYYILAAENYGTFKIIDSVDAQTTEYIHHNLNENTLYTYKIRAYNPDGNRTSSSCPGSVKSYTPKQPEFAFIRYATVVDNQYIKIKWVADSVAPVFSFKVQRSEDGYIYETITEISDPVNYRPETEFIDHTANFETTSYYYRIRVCDSCGVDTLGSENIARTIHLSGFPSFSGTTNELSWNLYTGWPDGVSEYRVFRKVNGSPDPSGPLNILPAGTNRYSDDVSGFTNREGVFSYYITAVENEGNNPFDEITDYSTSNEIDILQETKVIIPNAFTPGQARNNIFKPLTVFIDREDYSFAIFNKWGQLVFSTENIEEGWDGKINGEYAPSDAYAYILKYKTPEGQLLKKSGTITLVR